VGSTEEEILADAKRYLATAHSDVAGKRGVDLAKAIIQHQWTPSTAAEKVQLVAIAYALVCLHRGDTAAHAAIKSYLVPPPREPDLARIFVQGCYKEGADFKLNAKLAGNFYSRYAGAVRYLLLEAILPSEVQSLGARQGEGVSAWEKRNKAAGKPIGRTSLPTDARVKIEIDGKKHWWAIERSLALRWIKILDRKGTPVPKKVRATKSP
jgi:hypothetical protein